ncbi:response regulator [Leptolyngbya sp. FACHB-16]|uniref:response regulator n=1 Tax=unclassified Leptolyngbya TaxID=2650499 RepID=UPI001686BC32|nr:response regulator [Leptolyngbya sp. FACHB-16]MBD2155626.1 response regulator [Leptolyngbya sp. FACHB-16]
MRILIVDDDESIAELVKTALTEQRYTVDVAKDGQAGWQLTEDLAYDLILLDVMLPKLDGISFCQRLRSQGSQVPVLLLTAKDASSDKVAGLDAGADDYIVKPLDLQELAARIRALLRRGHGAASPLLEWGELRLNPQSCEVVYGSHPLHLTPKEYALLELFLRNTQRVFSRGAILDQLWAFDDEPPSEDTVKTHIKSLRQKLKAAGAADLIETVYGLGYRLNQTYLKSRITRPSSETKAEHTREVVAKIWERTQGKIFQRIQVLEQATEAITTHGTSQENWHQARQEAHKLAGALGTFGIQTGTQIARQIENLLEQQPPFNEQQKDNLQSLVRLLRQTVENESQSTPTKSVLPDLSTDPRLLVIGDDPAFLEILIAEASNWGVQIVSAVNFSAAKEQFEPTHPDAVLFDLPFAELEGESLAFFTEMANRTPPLPVIALTEFNQLSDRLMVLRLSGWSFLQKPALPSQVFTVVTQTFKEAQPKTVNILAVDDDPLILTALRAVLAPWGINVFTLQDPDQFWDRLPEVTPDLIMLDVEMPGVNGIELCQTLRNDIRWDWLPVLFLTGRTDADMIAQIFTVGADDYINKPIVFPELVARILNRLERQRSLRNHLQTKHWSDVGNQQQFTQDLNRFLKLAKRFQQPLCLAVLDVTQRLPLDSHSEREDGDVLSELEQRIRKELNDEDLLTHWEKNRWVVGLYGTTRQEGVERLATIIETIRELQFNTGNGEPRQVTLNAGVAQYPEDEGTLQALYHSAETLLTHALPEGGRALPVGWKPQPQNSPQTEVLLVHHDPTFAASLITAVETRGYHYRWVQSGKKALAAIAGVAPELRASAILWAADLPDMEVQSFLKQWKKNKLARHTRLILLLPAPTAQIDSLLELAAFDYVMTPCDPNVLMQCLYRSLQF